jgi:hypothetical protein
MVGALRGIVEYKPRVMKALSLGIGIGLLMEIIRKLIKNRPRFKEFAARPARAASLRFFLTPFFCPARMRLLSADLWSCLPSSGGPSAA